LMPDLSAAVDVDMSKRNAQSGVTGSGSGSL
jgi:hypothetical protein